MQWDEIRRLFFIFAQLLAISSALVHTPQFLLILQQIYANIQNNRPHNCHLNKQVFIIIIHNKYIANITRKNHTNFGKTQIWKRENQA